MKFISPAVHVAMLGHFIILVLAVPKQYDEDDEGEDNDKEEGDNDCHHDHGGLFRLRFVALIYRWPNACEVSRKKFK